MIVKRILNFPAVTIRQAHERPEGMDESTLMMSGLRADAVLNALEIAIDHAKSCKRPYRIVKDYDVDNVSKKVLRLILSYQGYVNRTVWMKR